MAGNLPDNNMPKIIVNSSDRATSPSQHKRKSSASTPPASTAPSTSKTQPTAAPNKSSSGFTSFLLFLLVCLGYGGCYWLYQQLQVQQQALQASNARIVELENKLSSTDEEMGQSTVALQVNVKTLNDKTEELWQQMDKLWASAWRRNQSDIKALKGEVNKQQRQSDAKDKALETSLNKELAQFNNINTQLTKLTQQTTALSNSLTAQSKTGKTSQQEISSLKEKLAMLDQTVLIITGQLTEIEQVQNELSAKIKKQQTQKQANATL